MAKTIRIGMLTARFYPYQGGAEIQCGRLSNELQQAGCGVLILTQKMSGTSSFELIDNLPVYRLGLPLPNRIGSFTYFLSSLKLILKKFGELDILHAHIASTPAIIAALVTRLTGKPSLVKFAGARNTGDIATSLRTPHGKLKLDFIRKNASAFVCPSGEISRELEKHGFHKEKIHVIPNGIDTGTFLPVQSSLKRDLKSRLGLSQEAKTIIYSGRIEDGKGLETLLDAWELLEGERPSPPPNLVLVGSGKLLRELSDRTKNSGSIRFEGWKNNVLDYLQAGDLFVLPSAGEGMPNSLLEAMSCGLASVATDIGGINELIEHRVNGLLFKPGDAAALAACIKALLSEAPLAAKLGASARDTIIKKYPIGLVAQEYLALYRKLLQAKGKIS